MINLPNSLRLSKIIPICLKLFGDVSMDAPIHTDKHLSKEAVTLMGGPFGSQLFQFFHKTFLKPRKASNAPRQHNFHKKILLNFSATLHNAAGDYFGESQIVDTQLVRCKKNLRHQVQLVLNVDGILNWLFIFSQLAVCIA